MKRTLVPRLSAAVALLIVLLALPARALAWDPYGHMVVAAAAWRKITNTKVKKRIGELLKLNPQYDDWVKGVPKARQLRVAFVTPATWPDCRQAGPGYTADGKNGGNPPAHVAASSQNIGYTDRLMHKY